MAEKKVSKLSSGRLKVVQYGSYFLLSQTDLRAYEQAESVCVGTDDYRSLYEVLKSLVEGGTFNCPHCGKDSPHTHFIDKKGGVHE